MTTVGRSPVRTGSRKHSGKAEHTSWIGTVRTVLTAWLGRPLASFHLILAVFGLLTVIGLVMVLSATSVESYQIGHSVYGLFKKQLFFVALGLVAFWFGLRLPLAFFRKTSGAFVLLCVVLLAAVLMVGRSTNGSRGWFYLGPISFQPVEVAKLALALWGSHVLVCKQPVLHQYRHLMVPVVPVALMMFTLVMLQPDMGSTITLAVVLIALLWFVGAPMRLFGTLLASALGAAVVLAIGASYRQGRLVSFFKPEDVQGAAYQANQALYALADGGLFGRGLGQGPSKWRYLPNLHTDFIFALVGEELGFVGALLVLGLFAALAVIGLRIAARNVDPWVKLLASALTVWLVVQAAINISYVVHLLPITGVTLPLISYGGTSVTTTMLVFGILANCARHEPEAVADLRSHGPGMLGRWLWLPTPPVYRQPVKRKPVRPSSPPRSGGRTSGAVRAPGQERRRTTRVVPAPARTGRRSGRYHAEGGPR